MEEKAMAFSWRNPLNWIYSRRHMLALIHDYTPKKRERMIKQLKESRSSDFTTDPPLCLRRQLPEEFSFLVLGDTGEGDNSQSVLVDKLLKEGEDTAFIIVGSDVVYPSGRFEDYYTRFYTMYRSYRHDIYAIPGNHDWYDGLDGFMVQFCNFGNLKEKDKKLLKECRQIRNNQIYQPSMYFTIDAKNVRIVCIDTGFKGYLDESQKDWLETVSKTDKGKILIAGNPIFVNGTHDDRLQPIHDITKKYHYLLYIAGDTHNYQHYEVEYTGSSNTFTIHHIVNGGGGAFLHSTSNIPTTVEVSDDYQIKRVKLYPDQERSRQLFGGWVRRSVKWIEATRLGPFVAGAIDAIADRDQPPFAQSFLKILVRKAHITVQMFCVEDFSRRWINEPPCEEFTIV
jgi:calcineurin-like phosphoesterase family protein